MCLVVWGFKAAAISCSARIIAVEDGDASQYAGVGQEDHYCGCVIGNFRHRQSGLLTCILIFSKCSHFHMISVIHC